MPIQLKTSSGRIVTLADKPFAKGGEGAVHQVIVPKNTGLCAKIYFPKERNSDRKRKIEYMINHQPPNIKKDKYIICWPQSGLYQGTDFFGFLMPLAFKDSAELYELCTPKINQKYSNWEHTYGRNHSKGIKSRLKLCTNLSIAIHVIHKFKSYVMVDLKPQNVLVTKNGKVSLIDCDSMQISNKKHVIFPAKVATPEYVPPEGNKINPSKNKVPHTWDYFSMAIMFYEVIFGLHPYAATFKGKYKNSTTLDAKIKDGLYVHGSNKSHISITPNLHKNYDILPHNIKQLFDRAFNQGHKNPSVRPAASEWGAIIYKELKKTVKFIPKVKTITKQKPMQPTVMYGALKRRSGKKISNIKSKHQDGIGLWCMFYLIVPFIGLVMALHYNLKGENKKGKQSLYCFAIGLFFFIIIYILDK